MSSDHRSNSSYYSDKGIDRDRDRDYDRRPRDYYRYDDRRLGSNRARDPSPLNYRRRDSTDRYYRDRDRGDYRDYDYGYNDSYRSRDSYYRSDRDRDYDRRDRYDIDRYRSPPPYRESSSSYYSRRDNTYYKYDRDRDRGDYRDYDRDYDYDRDRDRPRYDDYSNGREPRRNRRHHYDNSPSYQSADRHPNEYNNKNNPILDTPVHPPSDHHVRELSEPREVAPDLPKQDNKSKDEQSSKSSYQTYTSALLAGTSIKTSVNIPSTNKMLLRKPNNDALKPSSPGATEYKPMGIKGNISIADPRAKNATIGKAMVSVFDCIELSHSHRVATTLESPIVDFCTEGLDIFNTICDDKIVISPLERLNSVLYHKVKPITSEKWVPGCKTLMFVGFPRNLTSTEALQLLCEVYQKSILQNGYNTIYDDDWESDDDDYSESKAFSRRKFNYKLANQFGIVEFHLLFGESSMALNSLDLHYPQSTWKKVSTSSEVTTIKIPELTTAMAISVFADESKARQFWISINSTAAQVYSFIIQAAPDPLALRVYAEANCSFFDPEILKHNKSNSQMNLSNKTQKPKGTKKSDITLDLTIDFAPPNTNNSSVYLSENGFTHSLKNNSGAAKGTLKPKKSVLKDFYFIIPYVIDYSLNNKFAIHMGDIGFQVKFIDGYCCLGYTDEKLVERYCIGTHTFNAPTGDQITCTFIKYNDLLIPLVQSSPS